MGIGEYLSKASDFLSKAHNEAQKGSHMELLIKTAMQNTEEAIELLDAL